MNKVLFSTLVVLLIILSGCQLVKKDATQAPLGAFISGTSGLAISFLENAPPDSVYDNNEDEFNIALLLNNEGEYDIPSNKVIASLSGIRAEDFNIANLNRVLSTSVDGKTIRSGVEIKGAEEELIFEAAKYKHDLKADFTADVIVHACYGYVTNAIASICLKKDLLERGIADTCESTNSALNFDVSSGPIQISNVAQVPRGKSQLKLTFDISNDGDGEVYAPNAFTNTCYGKENLRDQLELIVSSPSGNIPVKCKTIGETAKGLIKLIDGKRSVECSMETASLQDISFETPILIDLNYFYRDYISKKITVLAAE